MISKVNYSVITLISICLFLSIYRMNNVIEKEISWDVLGYYLYLPATFIHDDPLFSDTSWLEKENEQRKLADTLYMVSSNNEGEPMYFFLMGTAILFLPFFLIGHLYSFLVGSPMNGFEMPYQYFMVAGGVIYTLIGLIFFRKILTYFFNDRISSILLIIIVFGTNYIHHLTLKNLETVNLLFTLASIITWYTIKWHNTQTPKYLFFIGISIALMGLIKPTEVLIFLLPLFWNVTTIQELKDKITLLLKHKKTIIHVLIVCFLLVLPQISYWFIKTGSIIYDTYKNPGVGLDILSPHVWNVLFSYRKGWLIYTPIMLFSLMGFFVLYQQNRKIFFAVLIYASCSFLIISSWSEWWYGAAFSVRPLITLYPLLAISMGYFIQFVATKSRFIQVLFGAITLFFIFLNQFQWWQLKNYILDPYRTTKAYYWKTFLTSSVTEKDRELLSINRSFTGINIFENTTDYQITKNFFFHFDKPLKINFSHEFTPFFQNEYREITQKDHVWIRASLDFKIVKKGPQPSFLTMTVERKQGNYGYSAPELKTDSLQKEWTHFQTDFLTPEIRNSKDNFKCYLWNQGKNELEIKNVRLEVFEKKTQD